LIRALALQHEDQAAAMRGRTFQKNTALAVMRLQAPITHPSTTTTKEPPC
jgi:hypothetical protein